MKKHDEEKIIEEPFRNWRRKQYIGPKPNDPRELAETETDRDLDKPIEQLLCDVQDSLQTWEKVKGNTGLSESLERAVSLILYSITRMTSMNAIVSIENSKLQKSIKRLTIWIWILTIILTAFGFIQTFFPSLLPSLPVEIQPHITTKIQR